MPTKVHTVKDIFFFPNSHVQIWELDHKEGWVPRNWCFQIVVLEKTFESLLDSPEIIPVNPKGNQPWIFIGRADAEAEAPILWPPEGKGWLIRKDLVAGKDWGQEDKRTQRIKWLDGIINSVDISLSKTAGDSEGQGRLLCCRSWDDKDLDMTEWTTRFSCFLLISRILSPFLFFPLTLFLSFHPSPSFLLSITMLSLVSDTVIIIFVETNWC